MLCPRREEVGAGPGHPFKFVPAKDEWEARAGHAACSWCGGMKPAEFLAAVEVLPCFIKTEPRAPDAAAT